MTTEREVRYQWRRGTSSLWTDKNPVLLSGEPGYESDTGQFKIGDGITAWNDLPYELGGGEGGEDPRIGNMADLSTTVKSTIVAAINEVNVPPVTLTTLYNNAKAG